MVNYTELLLFPYLDAVYWYSYPTSDGYGNRKTKKTRNTRNTWEYHCCGPGRTTVFVQLFIIFVRILKSVQHDRWYLWVYMMVREISK